MINSSSGKLKVTRGPFFRTLKSSKKTLKNNIIKKSD